MATNSRKDLAADFDLFRNLTMTFEHFKMTNMDTNSFIEARRKDVDALVAANKTTYEAMQALARAQTAMLTQAMQDMQELARSAMSGNGLGGDMSTHSEAAQKAWQRMLADMKQMAEVMQKAQAEAMSGLNERVKQSIGEMKGLTPD